MQRLVIRAGSNRHVGRIRQERRLARQVAITAIAVDFQGRARVIGFVGLLRLMLMAVVAKVRRLTPFMLAIRGRRCPGILERQHA